MMCLTIREERHNFPRGLRAWHVIKGFFFVNMGGPVCSAR